MEQQAARNLVERVFNSAYSNENYIELITNILKSYDRDFREINLSNEQKIFSKFNFLGSYDAHGDVVGIYEVELSNKNALNQARVAQRNLIANQLKNSNHSSALVSYFVENINEWRFSYVKTETQIDDSSDRHKFIEKLTPAKRQSFIAGPNEGTHTAKKQILPSLCSDDYPKLKDIEQIFQIEPVNDDFYDQYKELYLKLYEYLEDFFVKDDEIRSDFESKDISTSDFAKKTLGQFIFLYFVQKKDWIKNNNNQEHNFSFKELFNLHNKYGKNFFNDLIEPIFYEALGMRVSQRVNDYQILQDYNFPFLGSGLFEPIRGYDWLNTNIIIPNEFFKNSTRLSNGEEGNGLFDVFDRFNFTVYENDPLEQDIAVDPEMLGKVFENLLEVHDRKSKGAFYTPREIVQYMAKESIIEYLFNELNELIDKEKIEYLVLNNAAMSKENIESKELEEIILNAINIDDLLEKIKICDPAAGSGAFPIGILNEIVNTRSLLQPFLKNPKNIYDLKFNAICNSIYGVDLDPGAIEIARLRLWLSLIIEENEPIPLPNLDYKLMQGNSLLSTYQGIQLFDDEILNDEENRQDEIKKIDDEFDNLQKEFFNLNEVGETENPNQKKLQRSGDELDLLGKEYLTLDNLNQNNISRKKIIETRLKSLKKRRENLKQRVLNKQETENLFEDNNQLRAKQKILFFQNKITEFITEEDNKQKANLKKEIENLKWEIIQETIGSSDTVHQYNNLMNKRIQPFFLWKLEFSEIFKSNNGFDIVIANPPYIQLQKRIHEDSDIKHGDLYENSNFQTFKKTGDIYALFYEQATNIAKKDGVICYITSNKWMRAGYGDSLRGFLSKYNQLKLLDFAGNSVFKNATVDVSILLYSNSETKNQLKAYHFKDNFKKISIAQIFNNKSSTLQDLSEKTWAISDENLKNLKFKIENTGVPLMDWNIKINYGIKTGFNDAFIIDEIKKNELINKDPNSIEIIKPLLRGRDIGRYQGNFQNLYLISTFPSLKINIDKYPAVRDYLMLFGKKLEQVGEEYLDSSGQKVKTRKKTGNKWYETQDQISYHNEFEKDKIIYPNMTKYRPFFLDKYKFYTNDKCFIITGNNLGYLTGVLNSWLFDFAFKEKFPELLGGTLELRGIFFEKIPIPQINQSNQFIADKIEELAEKITLLKMENIKKDTSIYEDEIDDLVFKLYDFDEKDINIIKDSIY